MNNSAILFTIITLISLLLFSILVFAFISIVKRDKVVIPFIIFSTIAVVFTIIAQNDTWLTYFGLIVMFVLILTTLSIIIITLIIKKKRIKPSLITLLSTVISFSLIVGCFAFSNYQKDKWFYEFKGQIIKQYTIVKTIKLDAGIKGPSFFLSFYCEKNAEMKDIEPIFNTTKNYLFNNPSEINPSQQSRTKRGQGEYSTIYLIFYTSNSLNVPAKVIYEASYYTNGLRDEVDNFATWHITDGLYDLKD